MNLVVAMISLFVLASCSTANKKEYDSRTYSEKDKKDIYVYTSKYADLLSVGSSNPMFMSVDGDRGGQANTVQKFYCACIKKLGNNCIKNSQGLSESDRELWSKGNGAEQALKNLGYAQLADKDLCQ